MSEAYIHPKAKIGKNVTIGPFCYIAEHVEIGDGTTLDPHVTILDYVKIGKNNKISSGAVLGSLPQDVGFANEETWLEIGDNNLLREFSNMARGTFHGRGKTVMGNDNMLMAYSHVAHDCIIGNGTIIVSYVALAGFSEVHDYATLGGQAGVHQFNRVGAYSMIAASSKILKDVPPYVLTGRNPVAFYKLNLVGLRRRGFTREQIDRIESIYRTLYDSGLNVSDACVKIENDFEESVEKRTILDFIKNSKRGIVPKVSKLLSHD